MHYMKYLRQKEITRDRRPLVGGRCMKESIPALESNRNTI